MTFDENLRTALKTCKIHNVSQHILAELNEKELLCLANDWFLWARPAQIPPQTPWNTWLFLGGRGAGKTRAGAEWIKAAALGRSPFFNQPVERIALIGGTYEDVREVMIKGVSGILSIHHSHDRPVWKSSQRRLEWPNGAIAQVFSSEDPEGLRGPQFNIAWGDEISKWRYAEETWDTLQFALRLGKTPQQMATTTPKSTPLIKRLLKEPKTIITHSTTFDNAAYLAPGFLENIVSLYKGSRLERQELEGTLIDDRSDAMFQRKDIERLRIYSPSTPFQRIVVAIDPPATSHKKSDACGIVAAALGEDQCAYVLADETIKEARPHVWAKRALTLYHRLNGDSLIAEVNQGGDMVESILHQIDPTVPIKSVRATRGKIIRTEPIATLYQQGRVRHAGCFPELEDEMCDFGPSGLSLGHSPDRLDALVWALTALMLDSPMRPKIRIL